MERSGLAASLRSTTLERQRELNQDHNLTEQEKQDKLEKAVAEYVATHKEKTIDELAMAAMEAAEKGENTAKLKMVDGIEHRYGVYQTARDVRDYFTKEGFKAELDTGENGYVRNRGANGQEWNEPTECIALLKISWKN